MGRVGADLSSLDPKAARAQLEAEIGARLRGWIVRAEASFTDVAGALGMHRPELYDLMEGVRTLKAAWLYMLPPAVLRAALEDLASSIGYELRPVAVLDDDHDDDRSAVRIVHEATDVIRSVTETQADRKIDRQEAIEELREIRELEHALARRRARLNQVVAEGATVLPMPKPYRTGEG